MTGEELNDRYFEWLYYTVFPTDEPRDYEQLLRFLHETEFTYTIGMDGNRYEDGVDLRYRFGYLTGIDDAEIARYVDDKPCSVLEMMVALSLRIEENIMEDPESGDRTGEWFWEMLTNLGLDSMDNENFDADVAESVVRRLLEHRYSHDGEGGLFTIRHCKQDLRTAEIWYQANWYLNTIV